MKTRRPVDREPDRGSFLGLLQWLGAGERTQAVPPQRGGRGRKAESAPRKGRLIEARVDRRSRKPAVTARPGAAKSLPMGLISRLPVVGRLAVPELEPALPPSIVAKWRGRLSPQALLALARRRPQDVDTHQGLHIPLVSPMLNRVRQPLQSTARMVQAAREVRRPRTRWERLREAAGNALSDPRDSLRWETLMGLGVALAAGKGGEPEDAPRSAVARLMGVKPKPAREPKSLRATVMGRLKAPLQNKNADRKQARDRRRKPRA